MSDDKFRVLFEHSSDAHLIFDDAGMVDCNPAAVRLLRAADKQDVLRLRPEDISPEFQPDGRASREAAAEVGRIARKLGYHQFEWVHRRVDGEPVTVEVAMSHVTLDGRPAVVSVWRDLTERKRAESELLRLGAELRAANDRMKRDLDAAALVQRSLLPRAAPAVPGVGVAWVYRPCSELGGDSLNVFRLGDRHVGLYVLDVSGHGAAAALLSVTVGHLLSPAGESSLLHAPAAGSQGWAGLTPPAEVAGRLNDAFAGRPDSEQYFTLLYGILSLDTNEFRYVSAGHPGPVRVPAGGHAALEKVSGYPVGIIPGADYEESRVALGPGDRLVLYSDGVPEAMSPAGEPFGVGRLLAALDRGRGGELAAGVDALRGDVEVWCAQAGVTDDVSVLAVEITPARPGATA